MNDENLPYDEIVHDGQNRFYRVFGGFRYQEVDETQNGTPIGEPSLWFATKEEAEAAALGRMADL